MNNNKKLLSEFKIDYLDSVPFRDGYLVLEYVEGYEYPRYHIYYEIDDKT